MFMWGSSFRESWSYIRGTLVSCTFLGCFLVKFSGAEIFQRFDFRKTARFRRIYLWWPNIRQSQCDGLHCSCNGSRARCILASGIAGSAVFFFKFHSQRCHPPRKPKKSLCYWILDCGFLICLDVFSGYSVTFVRKWINLMIKSSEKIQDPLRSLQKLSFVRRFQVKAGLWSWLRFFIPKVGGVGNFNKK